MKFKNIMLNTEFVWRGMRFIKLKKPICIITPEIHKYDVTEYNAICIYGQCKGGFYWFSTKQNDAGFTQIK